MPPEGSAADGFQLPVGNRLYVSQTHEQPSVSPPLIDD